MAPGAQGHAGPGSSGHHDGQGRGNDTQGGTAADGPILDVSPEAVPALRSAFADALAKVDRQLELAANDLRLTPWAQDPISQDATEVFNNRSVDPDGSALDMLRAYRAELDAAVTALDAVTQQYQAIEQDNKVTVSQQPGGEA